MANMNMDIFSSIIGETRVLREGTSVKVAAKSARLKESARRLKEGEDLVPVDDQVIAVVDPDLDADEATSELQEIVDDAAEGEVPVADDYVDDHVYQCSICGNSFFSEDEITENPIICPVCGEESDVVAQGTVEEFSTTDNTEDGVDYSDDEVPEPAVEGLMRSPRSKKVVRESKATKYMFDDKRMSALVGNFFKENYKNVVSAKCVSASVTPSKSRTRTLTLECVVNYKSGKSNKIKFVTEGLILSAPRMAMRMTESTSVITRKMDKSRSKTPFVLECIMKGNAVIPTKLKYDFVIKEGRDLYRVSGAPRILD